MFVETTTCRRATEKKAEQIGQQMIKVTPLGSVILVHILNTRTLLSEATLQAELLYRIPGTCLWTNVWDPCVNTNTGVVTE